MGHGEIRDVASLAEHVSATVLPWHALTHRRRLLAWLRNPEIQRIGRRGHVLRELADRTVVSGLYERPADLQGLGSPAGLDHRPRSPSCVAGHPLSALMPSPDIVRAAS